MTDELAQAYETLRRNGHYPFMVLRLDEVQEYIEEYAQAIKTNQAEIATAIEKLKTQYDCSEEWRYAVEHIMEQLEKESAQ